MEQDLTVIYEDQEIAVIDKPAGLIVDRNGTNAAITIQDLAEERWPQLKRSTLPRAGIVHRLDKETSGLLLIALDDDSHQKLSHFFKDREITKKYISLVEGSIKEPLEIALPIGRSTKNRKKMGVEAAGKEAITRVEPRQYFDSGLTLAEITLLTGRTHQIRVHLSHIGHPIAGDTAYGARQRIDHLTRPFLHASYLSFSHPTSGERMEFDSDLPEELATVLKKLS